MTRRRMLGSLLCISAVAFATAAPSATAEAPEWGRCLKKPVAEGLGFSDSKCTKPGEEHLAHYEWLPGAIAGMNGFTMKGGSSTWATTSGSSMDCDGQSAAGEYSLSNPKRWENVQMRLTGCGFSGFKCTSEGSPVGELVFNELEGEVGYLDAASKKTALKLYPAPSAKGKFIEFKCVGVEVKIRGRNEEAGAGVLVQIGNDNMKTTNVLKYSMSKGVQKPDEWEGLPTETYLERSFEKLSYEQLGWTVTTTVTNEEAYELNIAI